jgi:uncharacterized membrane protein YccC
VSTPDPSRLRGSLRSAAFTLVALAVSLYVAIHLIEAVEPVLVVVGIAAACIYLVRLVYRRHNSGW